MVMLLNSSSLHVCSKPFTDKPCRNVLPMARAHAQQSQQQQPVREAGNSSHQVSRRQLLSAAGLLCGAASLASQPPPAAAFIQTPEGFRSQVDRLDGYSFIYPDQWAAVTSSGNDIFLRNPFNVEQNLFVDISSPSSSRYKSVEDLGSPSDAANKLLDRYLNKEFMSTRIGIRRQGEVLAASSRDKDGRKYYDVEVRMTSYASRNPYMSTPGEVMKDYGIEWDRRLVTTLGVANNRLYELRMQSNSPTYDKDRALLDIIRESFTVKEVEE